MLKEIASKHFPKKLNRQIEVGIAVVAAGVMVAVFEATQAVEKYYEKRYGEAAKNAAESGIALSGTIFGIWMIKGGREKHD